MARTIKEVLAEGFEAKDRVGELYTLVENEVDNNADLSALNSPSKTAEFKLWQYIVAALSHIQESVWGEAKDEIQTISDNAISATDPWLANEVKKFQNGDSLSFDNTTATYFYAVIDPAKQIIKRVAVVSIGGLTTLKVAKEDGGGNPLELDTPELNAFSAFVDRIQIAGTNIVPVSLPADLIKGVLTVYFDAQLGEAFVKPLVEAAYLGYLSNLEFNGQFVITKWIDAIQLVEGVFDAVDGTVEARGDSEVSFQVVNRVYDTKAGYLVLDAASSLDTLITYVPQ